MSHCSRVDNKRRISNANIKSSESCPAASCHTEKTHLQSQTTPCLTSFDPGPCDRSALFSCQVTQAPAPSLWMASILRRLSSGRPPQQRLHTLMLSNPPLPIHRQPRSRCATLLPSSGVRTSRWSGSGGFRTSAAQMYLADLSSQHTGTSDSVCCAGRRLHHQQAPHCSEAVSISTVCHVPRLLRCDFGAGALS